MNVTLRPNRDLLDPSFESYKLSLDKIPVFACGLTSSIFYKLPECSVSKQHIQLLSQHNCFYNDPFVPGDVYYIDSNGSIHRLRIPENTKNFNGGVPVYTFPKWQECTQREQPTLSFPSSSLALACDGDGMFQIFETERSIADSSQWKVIFSQKLPDDIRTPHLLDSVCTDAPTVVHCVFASVVERPVDLHLKDKSSYVTYIDWCTYGCAGAPPKWSIMRSRRFVGSSFPDYVSLTRNALALHICSEKSFMAIYDSSDATVAARVADVWIASQHHGQFFQSIAEGIHDTSVQLGSSRISLMSTTSDTASEDLLPVVPIQWSQSDPTTDDESGMIHVTFELNFGLPLVAEKVDRSAVQIQISPTEISASSVQTLKVAVTRSPENSSKVSSQSSESSPIILLDHQLYGFVEPKLTWTVDRQTNCLEVHLPKAHTLHWPRLLHDCELDLKMIKPQNTDLSASEVEHVQDGPETMGNAKATLKPAFNVEQLEEVDFPSDDSEDDLVLQRFDHDGLKLTHQAGLSGHPWLFNIPVDRNSNNWSSTTAVCLRHDVDGIVWLPNSEHTSTDIQWNHAATLQAFGYVLASKRDHRFVSSPRLVPDNCRLSFVAVADTSKRVYVYRQPLANGPFPGGDTELRRRTATSAFGAADHTNIVHVAWQHVISLPSDDSIVGFSSFDMPYPGCVVCTQNTMYLVSLIG